MEPQLDESGAAGLVFHSELLAREPKCIILHFSGYLHHHTSSSLKKYVTSFIEGGNTRLILELSKMQLSGMSRKPLDDFISLISFAKMNKARIVCIGMDKRMFETLSLLGFDRFLYFANDISSGLKLVLDEKF